MRNRSLLLLEYFDNQVKEIIHHRHNLIVFDIDKSLLYEHFFVFHQGINDVLSLD